MRVVEMKDGVEEDSSSEEEEVLDGEVEEVMVATEEVRLVVVRETVGMVEVERMVVDGRVVRENVELDILFVSSVCSFGFTSRLLQRMFLYSSVCKERLLCCSDRWWFGRGNE